MNVPDSTHNHIDRGRLSNALLGVLAACLCLCLPNAGMARSGPLPACRYDDVPTFHQDYGDWQLTLLDTIYKLPPDYAPGDLISTAQAGLSGDYRLRALVMNDLFRLVQAAEAEGLELAIQSAYRSYSYQERTFNYWVEVDGREAALTSSARPGHSEHQLGTVVDFKKAGGRAPWDFEDWAETPEGAWLAENAHRFGFIMSYPKGASETVCYIYEPWHYRYVGPDVAKAVVESGQTLREWLWKRQ